MIRRNKLIKRISKDRIQVMNDFENFIKKEHISSRIEKRYVEIMSDFGKISTFLFIKLNSRDNF